MSGSKTYAGEKGDQSRRITTAATTTVAARTAVLKKILVGSAFSTSITINDANGAKLVLGASIPARLYELNLLCAGKIEVVTVGTPGDVTVLFE